MSDVSITELIAETISKHRHYAPDDDCGVSDKCDCGFDLITDENDNNGPLIMDSHDEHVSQVVADALERVTVPTVFEPESPPCDGGCNYNDGPQETCSAHGRPVAEVWGIVEKLSVQEPDHSESPHLAAKYWAELVRARRRIAELEATNAVEPALAFVDQTIYANEDSSDSVTWTNSEVLSLLRDIRSQMKVATECLA